MYRSPAHFSRSQAERNNQMLSWARDDKSFFASGACHILAYTFFSLHPDKELEIVFLRPAGTASGGTIGCHAYVRQGSWAFDFQGWTLESELLSVTRQDWQDRVPGWDYTTEVVTDDLETFCSKTNHRPPAYFAFLPWARTYNYIAQFEDGPPSY
jgi:hypothetical protein